jgi:16S rRNA processing protein RimM
LAAEALIALGEIVNTHATHGELRVRLFNPNSTTLTRGATVVLRRRTDQQQRRIVGLRAHKHFLLLTLEGCDSMSAAEALIGCEVCVGEDELPPAGPDEVYHYQLLGMTVVTTAGTEIGVVKEVIPVVVRHVDHAAKRLVIDPLPGLLDP